MLLMTFRIGYKLYTYSFSLRIVIYILRTYLLAIKNQTGLDNTPKWAYLHFSCHGNYNWNDPSQSGLYLVEGQTLSLADLQNDAVDLSSARLVTLSACETGITDIVKGSADEFVGLPAGFMLAGVPCVVSSLWSVPDISSYTDGVVLFQSRCQRNGYSLGIARSSALGQRPYF
jgi:hypothetical protein